MAQNYTVDADVTHIVTFFFFFLLFFLVYFLFCLLTLTLRSIL